MRINRQMHTVIHIQRTLNKIASNENIQRREINIYRGRYRERGR